jgi:hypothetical protein
MFAGTLGLFQVVPPALATLKCRCGPQLQPVLPEKPMSWPCFTRSPTATVTALKCRYWVSSPSPWSMTT